MQSGGKQGGQGVNSESASKKRFSAKRWQASLQLWWVQGPNRFPVPIALSHTAPSSLESPQALSLQALHIPWETTPPMSNTYQTPLSSQIPSKTFSRSPLHLLRDSSSPPLFSLSHPPPSPSETSLNFLPPLKLAQTPSPHSSSETPQPTPFQSLCPPAIPVPSRPPFQPSSPLHRWMCVSPPLPR